MNKEKALSHVMDQKKTTLFWWGLQSYTKNEMIEQINKMDSLDEGEQFEFMELNKDHLCVAVVQEFSLYDPFKYAYLIEEGLE